MKIVSDNFKNTALAPVKQSGGSVTVYDDDGGSTTYTEDDVLQSIEIESSGELFGSVASVATVKLLGGDYDSIKNKDVGIRYRLFTESGQEAIDFGIFKAYEVETNKSKEATTIKLKSQMMIFQDTPYSTIDGFPMTVTQMAQKVADVFSISLGDMTGLPNADKVINEELYSKITGENYRNVVSEIAGVTGTMAIVNGVGDELSFRTYQDTVQEELDYNSLRKLTIGEKYGPINTLVLSRLPQEDNIVVADEEMVSEDGAKEIKIANNEIMDDDREAYIEPLFDAVKGIEWTGFEAETVGLGWLECGDRISLTDDNDVTIEGIITYVKVVFNGGVKELIKGVIPEGTTTDYALAGGVKKTIYTTEIRVDKQGQEIQSIVAEQVSFENETIENFSRVTQSINSVITSVQNSGGSNVLKNSAFYNSDDDGEYTYWNYATKPSVEPSGEASVYGSISGNIIHLAGLTISQTVQVKQDSSSIPDDEKTFYSFSCRIKKAITGTATVTITDGTADGVWTITLPSGTSAEWKEYAFDGMLPHSETLVLAVTGSNDSGLAVTDMILSTGSYHTQWQQAKGEVSSTSVIVDIDGVTAKNGSQATTYTKINQLGIEVYNNRQLVGALNGDEVLAGKGNFKNEIDMPPIKVIPLSDGWAFVSTLS